MGDPIMGHSMKHFSVHQFENGLTVLLEFMPEAVSTAVGFVVQTGARDEAQRFDGVSHFLEHMMFKGTANRTWQDINSEFDQMGARYNAFTAWEETCYYAWVLNEAVPRALNLLSDMLASALPEHEFVTEKKVILEEIARYRDMPEHEVFENALKTAYGKHRLASNVLGSPNTIKKLTRDQMAGYFQARYVPNNITLIACGRIDEASFIKDVEQLWGTRQGSRATRRPDPPRFQTGKKIVYRAKQARQQLVLLWPMLPVSDRRGVAASLLGSILGDDQNSRLYWALKHTALAEDAGGGFWGFSDAGLMVANASCDPDKAERVCGIMRAEAKKLKKGIKPVELQRVKNRARTALVFAAETPFNRFNQLLQQWMLRRELLTPQEMLARVNEVEMNDLYELLEEYPLDGPGVMSALGPSKKMSSK